MSSRRSRAGGPWLSPGFESRFCHWILAGSIGTRGELISLSMRSSSEERSLKWRVLSPEESVSSRGSLAALCRTCFSTRRMSGSFLGRKQRGDESFGPDASLWNYGLLCARGGKRRPRAEAPRCASRPGLVSVLDASVAPPRFSAIGPGMRQCLPDACRLPATSLVLNNMFDYCLGSGEAVNNQSPAFRSEPNGTRPVVWKGMCW